MYACVQMHLRIFIAPSNYLTTALHDTLFLCINSCIDLDIYIAAFKQTQRFLHATQKEHLSIQLYDL